MSTPTFHATPGYGDTQLTNLRYNQAVRVGDRVERTLATAGATWRDVITVNSYHVLAAPHSTFEDHNRVMADQFRARMGDRAPIWTESGVTALGAPAMRVEIRVTAVVGHDD